jgi:hypothetical protein
VICKSCHRSISLVLKITQQRKESLLKGRRAVHEKIMENRSKRELPTVPGHFAERHFAERHFAERHFAERTFCRRSFCRTDVLPNGHFAERTVRRMDNLPKIKILFRQNVWACDSFLNCVILNHCVK